jgi:DNA-binding MarR family transcriptional regulator
LSLVNNHLTMAPPSRRLLVRELELPMTYQMRHGEQLLPRQTDSIREPLLSALRAVDQLARVPTGAGKVSEADVRAVLGLRRSRERFFDADLFADPAWDILLELYAADLGQQHLSVTSVCLGAAVPGTTALRWIGVLEKKMLIQRRADRLDGRRVFLMLTEAGKDLMDQFFRKVPAGVIVT